MKLANRARILNCQTRLKFGGKPLPFLLFMTDETRMNDPIPAIKMLPRGAGVILRHYDLPKREALARELLTICRLRGLVLLIAGDLKLAKRLGCGAHLPEGLARKLPSSPAGFIKDHLLTVAAHSPRAIAKAKMLNADALLLSPVFPTRSHPGAKTVGASQFRLWISRGRVPAYALGGVDITTSRTICVDGVAGFAGISGLLD